MGVGLAPGVGSTAAFVVVIVGAPTTGVALDVSADPPIVGVVWTFVLFLLCTVRIFCAPSVVQALRTAGQIFLCRIDKDYIRHME